MLKSVKLFPALLVIAALFFYLFSYNRNASQKDQTQTNLDSEKIVESTKTKVAEPPKSGSTIPNHTLKFIDKNNLTKLIQNFTGHYMDLVYAVNLSRNESIIEKFDYKFYKKLCMERLGKMTENSEYLEMLRNTEPSMKDVNFRKLTKSAAQMCLDIVLQDAITVLTPSELSTFKSLNVTPEFNKLQSVVKSPQIRSLLYKLNPKSPFLTGEYDQLISSPE